MKNKKTIALLLLCFTATVGSAQQAITASGGNASGSGGSVSYSVGQIDYTTYTGTNGSVSSGVQQAFEISTTLSSPEFEDISLQLSVYPNPTVDILTLNLGGIEPLGLNYQLFNLSGKLIISNRILSNTETISMANLPTATYILTILSSNKTVKSFKIIKRI